MRWAQTDCHDDTQPACSEGKNWARAVAVARPSVTQAVHCCGWCLRGVGAVLSNQPAAVSNPLLLSGSWGGSCCLLQAWVGCRRLQPWPQALCGAAVTESSGATLPASPGPLRFHPLFVVKSEGCTSDWLRDKCCSETPTPVPCIGAASASGPGGCSSRTWGWDAGGWLSSTARSPRDFRLPWLLAAAYWF